MGRENIEDSLLADRIEADDRADLMRRTAEARYLRGSIAYREFKNKATELKKEFPEVRLVINPDKTPRGQRVQMKLQWGKESHPITTEDEEAASVLTAFTWNEINSQVITDHSGQRITGMRFNVDGEGSYDLATGTSPTEIRKAVNFTCNNPLSKRLTRLVPRPSTTG